MTLLTPLDYVEVRVFQIQMLLAPAHLYLLYAIKIKDTYFFEATKGPYERVWDTIHPSNLQLYLFVKCRKIKVY